MVLVQIIITPSNNGSFFPIGISGKCSLRVLSYDHHDVGQNNTARIIQVRSDQLYFPYSPARYLTILTHQDSPHTVDDSQGGFHLNNVVINGGIQLQVVNYTTGAQPVGFTFGLLTLSIEQINRDVEVE